MPKKAFIKINEERRARGEAMWGNPRNVAAGALKLLNVEEVAKRELAVIIYHVIESREHKQSEIYPYLKKIGASSSV